jgi:tripeptide aminopeptidase
MVDHLGDAANAPDCECDLDVSVARLFDGYRTRESAPQVRAAQAALRDCGYEPQAIVTGGGSDANVLLARGFPATNLANGTERNHQPDERVSVSALEGMLDLALALVRHAGPGPA